MKHFSPLPGSRLHLQDQHLLHDVRPDGVLALPRDRGQGLVADGGQNAPACVLLQGAGLDQIVQGWPEREARSTWLPRVLMTCISSVWRSTRTRVIRM